MSRANYRPIVTRTLARFQIKVRRWRTSMSGCAWTVRYTNGHIGNYIEAPRPRTPISLVIFLHEIGHHAIGFNAYKKRCEEEFHAWQWALKEMRRCGVEPDNRVRRRVRLSLQYAVGKAQRRGIRTLPHYLLPYSTA
jgi:hypothetical protein